MNDRYLYRAKRTDNGKWVEGHLVFDDIDNQYRIAVQREYSTGTFYGAQAPRVKRDTICQCNGLKDKNGKLIWENDIVRYTDMITGVEKIDRIEWNETHASFVRLHRSQMGLQYLNIDEFIASGCEVIGSAVDNPELLEVGE